MAIPDLVDEVLGWGEFVLATGRAFSSEMDQSSTNAPHRSEGDEKYFRADVHRRIGRLLARSKIT